MGITSQNIDQVTNKLPKKFLNILWSIHLKLLCRGYITKNDITSVNVYKVWKRKFVTQKFKIGKKHITSRKQIIMYIIYDKVACQVKQKCGSTYLCLLMLQARQVVSTLSAISSRIPPEFSLSAKKHFNVSNIN